MPISSVFHSEVLATKAEHAKMTHNWCSNHSLTGHQKIKRPKKVAEIREKNSFKRIFCVCSLAPSPSPAGPKSFPKTEELHGRVAWSCLPGLRGTSGESVGPHKRVGEEEAAGGHKHLGRGGLRV